MSSEAISPALTALRHRRSGTPFSEWLTDPAVLVGKDPIALMEIYASVTDGFGTVHEREMLICCVKTLLTCGRRPALHDPVTGSWQWTDRFAHFADPPDHRAENVAWAIWTAWTAFGTSDVENVWFASALPE